MRFVGGTLRIEPRLFEQCLVPEQHRHVLIERYAVQPVLPRRHRTMALGDRLERRIVADEVGDVLELAGAGELGTVDQVEPHQIGDVTGRDRLGELGDHLGVRDVGQVDLTIRVRLIPGRHQRVDHRRIATRPLPHLEIATATAAAAIVGCGRVVVGSAGGRRVRRGSVRRGVVFSGDRAPSASSGGDDVVHRHHPHRRRSTKPRDHERGQLTMCLHQLPPIEPAQGCPGRP